MPRGYSTQRYILTCPHCKTEFTASRSDKKWCSRTCASAASYVRCKEDPEWAEKWRQYRKEHSADAVRRAKKWNQKHRERRRRQLRLNSAWRQFGLTEAVLDALYKAQDGRCAICHKLEAEENSAFHIDHDHRSGQVRGLLCGHCNKGLGMFYDSPVLLSTAIAYLERRPQP